MFLGCLAISIAERHAFRLLLVPLPHHQPAFTGLTTFGRLRHLPDIAEEIDLAVLGVPFDGLVTFRPGARFGPAAIRQSSVLCRNYSQLMDVGVYERLRSIDAGDVSIEPFDHQETFRRIESRVAELQARGAAVVALGGDHSILLPILRTTSKRHPGLTLIQFDAHSDTSEGVHHGTSIRNAIEEGLVEGTRVFQIGIRGTTATADYNDFSTGAGIHRLDMAAFHDPVARRAFLETLRQTAGPGPCYLTFDIKRRAAVGNAATCAITVTASSAAAKSVACSRSKIATIVSAPARRDCGRNHSRQCILNFSTGWPCAREHVARSSSSPRNRTTIFCKRYWSIRFSPFPSSLRPGGWPPARKQADPAASS